MIIDLTQHHIDDAHRYRDNRMQWCRYCPIALAAKDAGLIAAQVTSTALSFETDAGERSCVGLPPVALDLLERFDRGEHVDPTVFTVVLEMAS